MMRYQLHCVDCSFADEMEADVFDVLDEVEAHKQETNDGHFVEFEAVEA